MSTHFLFDVNTNPVANSKLRDIRRNIDSSPVVGTFVVRLKSDITIEGDPPTNFASLVTQKYAAILAFYPMFSNIVYDEMSDGPSIDYTNSQACQVGARGSGVIISPLGYATSTMFSLGSTPSQAIITWETYSISYSDFRADFPTKTYNDESSSILQPSVSFNGGSTFHVLSDGALYNINPSDQGNQAIVRFANSSGSPLYLGSWALVY